MPVRIEFGFFCEDVRREFSGQTTAVGLWGNRLPITESPAIVRSLAFHLFLDNPDREPLPFEIVVDVPGQPPTVGGGALAVLPERQGNFLGIIMAPIQVMAPSTIRATVRVAAQPPIEAIFSLNVVLVPPLPAPAV